MAMLELLIGATLVAAGAWAVGALRKRDRQISEAAPRQLPQHAMLIDDEPDMSQLSVGDVLLMGGEEFWLAGELTTTLTDYRLRAFVCPGNVRGTAWIVTLEKSTDWLIVAREVDSLPEGRIPDELTLSDRRYRVLRRGQAVVDRAGRHLPDTADDLINQDQVEAVFLEAPGGRYLLVLDGPTHRIALKGERTQSTMIDWLPSARR